MVEEIPLIPSVHCTFISAMSFSSCIYTHTGINTIDNKIVYIGVVASKC